MSIFIRRKVAAPFLLSWRDDALRINASVNISDMDCERKQGELECAETFLLFMKYGCWTTRSNSNNIILYISIFIIKVCLNKVDHKNNNAGFNIKSRAKTSQSTTGLMSTCPQIVMNDHPTTLGMTCRQYVESPTFKTFYTGITATNQ